MPPQDKVLFCKYAQALIDLYNSAFMDSSSWNKDCVAFWPEEGWSWKYKTTHDRYLSILRKIDNLQRDYRFENVLIDRDYHTKYGPPLSWDADRSADNLYAHVTKCRFDELDLSKIDESIFIGYSNRMIIKINEIEMGIRSYISYNC